MLELCKLFFEYLNSNGVQYCHWKSNLNLDKSLSGKTDLDLLVAPSSQQAFIQAIDLFGLIKIISPHGKQFPGLEDFLGFDQATGRLIHIHVHYALVMGEKFIKNHLLPLNEQFFNNVILSSQGLWIPRPELELILLVLRAHMKADLVSLVKHQIKDCLGKRYNPFPDHIHEEFLDLIKHSDMNKARSLFRECNLPLNENIIFSFVRELSEDRLHAHAVARRKIQILFYLRSYQRQNSLSAYFRYFTQILHAVPLWRKCVSSKKKTILGGGKVFALVGADGSGKSTIARDLEAWLSWKIKVRRIYYGIPKTAFVQFCFWVAELFEKLRLNQPAKKLHELLWVYIARKRYVNSVQAHRFALQGEVVISDRFPLKDFHAMTKPMDGPRLSGSDSRLARSESGLYHQMVYPHCIFVLSVDIDELRKRKTDLPFDAHILKAEAVNSITKRDGLVIVDANRRYEEVLLEIKRIIWQEFRLNGGDPVVNS